MADRQRHPSQLRAQALEHVVRERAKQAISKVEDVIHPIDPVARGLQPAKDCLLRYGAFR
jgi:hypothetical protein